MTSVTARAWPALPLDAWRDTYATLHMWTQIVGTLCLALTTLSHHFWNIAFHVTSRGLATPTLTVGDHSLMITFDFVSHQLVFQCSDGRTEAIALEPRTVADFYARVTETLQRLGVEAKIWTMPVEIPDPLRFEADTIHRSYDRAQASAFWQTLVVMKPVFERFRCDFVGKCSPVHFFWGSFDLAVTRFSGRRAPPRAGADPIPVEAYSHEVISHGFWPGSGTIQQPAFYAYAAPKPAGFKDIAVLPAAAYYSKELAEFILPYEAVRTAASPEKELTAFFETTYDPAARLASWNRADLERKRDTTK